MATPSFDQLAEAYRDLLSVALRINDQFRVQIDHPVFDGSTNDIDDLRVEVNRHLYSWDSFIYPEPR